MILNISSSIDYDPWEENSQFIQEVGKLKSTDINNHKEVHAAIEALEVVEQILESHLREHEMVIDENDKESILNLYRRSLAVFKANEGFDLRTAFSALKTCLRLIQLSFGLLYDCYWDFYFETPSEIRELI